MSCEQHTKEINGLVYNWIFFSSAPASVAKALEPTTKEFFTTEGAFRAVLLFCSDFNHMAYLLSCGRAPPRWGLCYFGWVSDSASSESRSVGDLWALFSNRHLPLMYTTTRGPKHWFLYNVSPINPFAGSQNFDVIIKGNKLNSYWIQLLHPRNSFLQNYVPRLIK